MKQLTMGRYTTLETCKRTLPALQPKQPVKVQVRAGVVRPRLIQDGDAKIGKNIDTYT